MAKKTAKPKKQVAATKLTGTRTCSVCGRELPIVHFSTLARYAAQGIDSPFCTYCAWVVLVTHRASYERDDEGWFRVVMRPREKVGNIDLFKQVWEALPKWLKDEAVLHRYSGIGEIDEQIAPFKQFHADVKSGTDDRSAFVYGRRDERVY